jgi:hypothetical protein
MQDILTIILHPENRLTTLMWLLVIVAVYYYFYGSPFEGFTAVGNAPLDHAPITDANKVDMAMCSPKCCLQPYPTGITLNDTRELGNHVPTPYRCTGEGGPGCVCLSAEQRDFVGGRAGNGTNSL